MTKRAAEELLKPVKKLAGSIKIMSWNIVSWTNFQKKKGIEVIEKELPDILLVQETKLNAAPGKDHPLAKLYPHSYWHCCTAKKGYSGTAVLSKIKPIRTIMGIEGFDDNEGRVITLELDKFYLVAAYVPNASTGLKRLAWKVDEWNQGMLKHLQALKGKPIIYGGDMNVAQEEIDLARPKENRNKTAGFTDKERESMAETKEKLGLVDIWRVRNPDTQAYSYYSFRFNCKQKNIGWRLDFFLVSNEMKERVKHADIHQELHGISDHCPVTIEVEFTV